MLKHPPFNRSGLLSSGDYSGQCIVQLFRFGIIHRDDESAPTFERYAHNDEPTLLNSLHWAVSGPWFHRCHAIPFRG